MFLSIDGVRQPENKPPFSFIKAGDEFAEKKKHVLKWTARPEAVTGGGESVPSFN